MRSFASPAAAALSRGAFAAFLLAASASLSTCLSAGCAPATQTAATSAASKPRATSAVTEFTSKPWGFSTSSYWIEGPTGLIAIDTQFLPSEAERMIATAEKETGKKFELAVVLHANPDKFNGTATFQKHGIKVVTSQQVKDLLPAVHAKRTKAFYERYAPDYPKELPSPEVFGDKTTTLGAAGLTFTLHVVGAGCSEAHVVLEWEKHVFVGDLVGNGVHSWLEIGKTDEWLRRLDEIQALGPTRVHPGRGTSGPNGLLTDERAYLENVIAIVRSEKPTLPMQDEAFERAKAKIIAAYPKHDFPVFLEIGLPAEWARQARAASPK